MDAVARFLGRASRLPPLPDAITRLLEVINSASSTADDLARVIEIDSVLSTRLLGLANSVFYGMRGHVSTVKHAVVILGHKTIRSMALVLWTHATANVPLQQRSLERLQREMFMHGLATATAARMLASRAAPELTEDIFAAGLLHDIGRVTLIYELQQAYEGRVLRQAASENRSPAELERELLEFDHAQLGAALLASFHLPDLLVQVTADHLATEISLARPCLACVVLANSMTAEMGHRIAGISPPLFAEVRRELGLEETDRHEAFLQECNDRIQLLLDELTTTPDSP